MNHEVRMMKKEHNPEGRLVRLFGSISRTRILSLFVKGGNRAYYQREVMYETGLSLQAVQRELSNLTE
jgi:hypothetical protein